MTTLRRVLLSILSAAAGLGMAAAEVQGAALAWQVSPDRRSLWLEWHDPGGIRAVFERTTDLQAWHEVSRVFLTPLTDFTFRPAIHPGGRPWWEGDRPVEVMQVFRVRRWTPPRQGRVLFGNRVLAAGINAPVTFLGDLRPGPPLGGSELADSRFLAQLLVDVAGVYHGPVGAPVPFRSDAGRGFVFPSEVMVPVAEGTDEVHVTMSAWAADLGTSYYEALSKGIGYTGVSQVLIIRPALNAADPAAPLVGLWPFEISVPIGSSVP